MIFSEKCRVIAVIVRVSTDLHTDGHAVILVHYEVQCDGFESPPSAGYFQIKVALTKSGFRGKHVSASNFQAPLADDAELASEVDALVFKVTSSSA